MFFYLNISAALLLIIYRATAAEPPQPGLAPGLPGQSYFTSAPIPNMGISGAALFARQQPYICTDPTSRKLNAPSGGEI